MYGSAPASRTRVLFQKALPRESLAFALSQGWNPRLVNDRTGPIGNTTETPKPASLRHVLAASCCHKGLHQVLLERAETSSGEHIQILVVIPMPIYIEFDYVL